MMYDAAFENTSGVRFTKPPPCLAKMREDLFQPAVDWVSQHLRTLGYDPVTASFDCYRKYWDFYDCAHEHIYSCPHDLLERIHIALFEIARRQSA